MGRANLICDTQIGCAICEYAMSRADTICDTRIGYLYEQLQSGFLGHHSRHLQCPACILKQGLLGSSPTRRNSLPLGRGYGRREIPDLWSAPVQGITISESSQLSSISQLGRSHPVSPLRLHIVLKIAQTYCAIPRLTKLIAQSQD